MLVSAGGGTGVFVATTGGFVGTTGVAVGLKVGGTDVDVLGGIVALGSRVREIKV